MLLVSACIFCCFFTSAIKPSTEIHYSLLISHFECTAIRIGPPVSHGLFLNRNSIVFKSSTWSTFSYRTCPRSNLHKTGMLQFQEDVMKQFLIASVFMLVYVWFNRRETLVHIIFSHSFYRLFLFTFFCKL